MSGPATLMTSRAGLSRSGTSFKIMRRGLDQKMIKGPLPFLFFIFLLFFIGGSHVSGARGLGYGLQEETSPNPVVTGMPYSYDSFSFRE